MSEQAEHSDEAVAEALRSVFRQGSEEPEPDSAPAEQVAETQPDGAEDSDQPEPAETESQPEDTTESDVEALKARYEQQIADVRTKAAQSVEWAKSLGLKKASELDGFRKRVEDFAARIKRGEEVDQSELEALIGSNGQPSPQAVQPPSPFAQPVAPQFTDTQVLDIQQFQLETGLSDEQMGEFGQWIQQPGNLSPRVAAISDLYGLLSSAYSAYEKAQAKASPANAKAVRTAARVQKAAAKAASAVPGRSGPSSPPDKSPPDVMSLPDEQRHEILGRAMRQIWEENTGN